MGVHGLWRLVEPSGKPVPLETLENKVLAIDVSLWLHQAVKGFQDSRGGPVPNAHLLGIYHRVCKLLYFKVKPVFVFDGGVPVLKQQTIAKRSQVKSANTSEADKIQKQLLDVLVKHSVISKVLLEKTKASLNLPPKKASRHESMYVLPASEHDSTLSSSEEEASEDTDSTEGSPSKHWDLHTIDVSSTHFKSLPIDVRHEILTDLKETRKQSSWGRLHELPKQSDDFSVYQMKRLLKRQAVQSALEDAEKEMGGHSLSLAELESILKDRGVVVNSDIGKRIASDENTRYLLIKDVKQAMENARNEQLRLESLQQENGTVKEIKEPTYDEGTKKADKSKPDLEFEEDLQKAIALSLEQEPSTSKNDEGKMNFSFLENFNDADFQSDSCDDFEEVPVKKTLSSAHSYMIEYSGLTPNEIAKIINDKSKKPLRKKTKTKQNMRSSELNKIQIISDSDSDEFVEVHAEATKSSTNFEIADNVSVPVQYNIKEVSVEKQITHNTTESGKSGESSVNETKTSSEKNVTENKEQLDHIEIIHSISNSSKSDEPTEEVKQNSMKGVEHKPDNATQMPDNEIKHSISSSNEPTTVSNTEENEKTKNIKKHMDVELISDSDDSNSSTELLEVSGNKEPKKFMEIVVDPNQEVDMENDLFSDIFKSSEGFQRKESLEIVIQPQAKLDDDLFGDVFTEKFAAVEEKADATSFNTEKREMKTNMEIPKQDKILVRKDAVESENVDKTVINTSKTSIETIKPIPNIQKARDSAKENKEIENEVKKIRKLNLEQMKDLKEELQREKKELSVAKSAKERMAANITDQMYQEAQDLLELFGVPYIIAPMEAEAQCAFLDEIDLTDGTITEDSDIWLFGGRTVYKNVFHQGKYVMEFKAENINHHFKLTREQMILLAMLVGSDYTTGIQGIGPVTALEILAAFPPSQSNADLISGLQEFRSWLIKGKAAGPGRSALKNKLKNVHITDNFPSLQVVQAYLEPTIDTSRERFSWSKPDFSGLTEFAKEKFGWSAKKTEEILKPVIRRIEEKRTQKSIKDYFKTTGKVDSGSVENQMSKRVKTAIGRIGKTPEELIAEEMEALSKATAKKARGKNSCDQRKKRSKAETSSKTSNQKAVPKKVAEENKLKMRRYKRKEDTANSINDSNKKIDDISSSQIESLEAKKPKKKEESSIECSLETITTVKDREAQDEASHFIDERSELKKYENIAMELKKRRQRRNELSKIDEVIKRTPLLKPPTKKNPVEPIPEDLKEDEEIQFLEATTSRSLKRVEEIDQEMKSELEQDTKKKRLPYFHKKEVIHQKLIDKSDLLRNKMKAIEVFRKSKKGPGFVGKRKSSVKLPKEDAGLSENSSDE